MRIVVCGGRTFDDWEALKAVLDALHAFEAITEVIEGGAAGADMLARLWAEWEHDIPVTTVLAEWKKYGPKAGPLRNVRMAEMKPDLVVAFPGGQGTQNMIMQARTRGIQVSEVKISYGGMEAAPSV